MLDEMSQHFRDNYSSTFYYVVQSHSILKAGRGGIVFNISGCLGDFSLELWPAAFGLPPRKEKKSPPQPHGAFSLKLSVVGVAQSEMRL